MTLRSVWIMCGVLSFIVSVIVTLKSHTVVKPVMVEQKIQEFTLPKLHDPQQLLDSTALLGHVSLLNVWASWCINCREEHALLMELADQNNIRLYGLNYQDQRTSPAKQDFSKFCKKHPTRLPGPTGNPSKKIEQNLSV